MQTCSHLLPAFGLCTDYASALSLRALSATEPQKQKTKLVLNGPLPTSMVSYQHTATFRSADILQFNTCMQAVMWPLDKVLKVCYCILYTGNVFLHHCHMWKYSIVYSWFNYKKCCCKPSVEPHLTTKILIICTEYPLDNKKKRQKM